MSDDGLVYRENRTELMKNSRSNKKHMELINKNQSASQKIQWIGRPISVIPK